MFTDIKKSKHNRFKVGQKVKAKPALVNWYSTHLCWTFGSTAPKGDRAYSENEKEIQLKDLRDVYAWIDARLSARMPMGTVSHYGSKEDDSNRLNVYVSFKFKTRLGIITYGTYVQEKDLWLVKTKSK